MAVVLKRGDHGGRVVGVEGRNDGLMPRYAVAGPVMASFLTQIHGHGQLQFEQDGLQCDVQLPVACQFHYGGVKSAVRVVALQFICRRLGFASAARRRPLRAMS